MKRTDVYTLGKLLFISPNVRGHIEDGMIPLDYMSHDNILDVYAAANVGKVKGVYMLVLDKDDYIKTKSITDNFDFNRYWISCERTLVNELQENNIHVIHFQEWLEKERNKVQESTVSHSKSGEAVPEPPQPETVSIKEVPEKGDLENIAFVDDRVILGTGGTSFNEKPTVNYEENPHHVKKREIQKKLFSNKEWANHKIIGIWSPTSKCGATLTTINLALAFAEMRVYTTVLEGLTTKPRLKQHLDCYSSVPKGWVSYASCIQEDNDPRNASWIYENVVFLPMSEKDLHFKWNPQLIETYMTAPKITDVTFVDLSSGRFSDHMKDALHCLDEIWVMYDDNFHELMSWKTYFQSLTDLFDVKLYGIMGRTYEFSKAEKIAESVGLSYLTSIPAMDNEVMHHYYENTPLWKNSLVKKEFFDSYNHLYEHIFSDKMQFKEEKVDKKMRWPRSFSNVLEKLAPKI